MAFGSAVIPAVVQELVDQGLIRQCVTRGEVKITRKGKNRLERTIDGNIDLVLNTLAKTIPGQGTVAYDGRAIQELTDLTPNEINEAVGLLEEAGFVTLQVAPETDPFSFHQAQLTQRGKYEIIRQTQQRFVPEADGKRTVEREKVLLPPTPVGSPFGFSDTDWEIVIEKKKIREKLFVVFGYQFKSTYYDTRKLEENIQQTFLSSIEGYKNNNPDSPSIVLDFKLLSAGYGNHLFNEIARDIISADIGVFEASDLNANVMIEIGVALTWGIRVLPLRDKKAPKLPSDISGLTWVEYTNNGLEFLPDHVRKLISIIEFAIRKKRSF